MLTIFGWLLSLAFAGGFGWVAWKRAVENERVRREIRQEQTEKAKEAKDREAKILSLPNDPKSDVIRRMRENRDKT